MLQSWLESLRDPKYDKSESMNTGDDIETGDPETGRSRWGRQRRPRRGGRITVVIVAVVLVPLLVLGSGIAWFFWQLDGHGDTSRLVHVQLDRRWGVPRIGEQLHHDHIIGSSFVFNVYSRSPTSARSRPAPTTCTRTSA